MCHKSFPVPIRRGQEVLRVLPRRKAMNNGTEGIPRPDSGRRVVKATLCCTAERPTESVATGVGNAVHGS